MLVPEEKPAPPHLRRRQPRLCRDAPDEVCHGRRVLACNDFVGNGPQRRAAPRDCRADLAGIKQVVVVFGISDADGVVNGQPQREQRLPESGGLADGLRQQHQAAAVEREDEWLLGGPDGLEHLSGPLGVGFDDALPGHVGDAAAAEFLQEQRTRPVPEQDMAAAGRELEDRAGGRRRWPPSPRGRRPHHWRWSRRSQAQAPRIS